MKNRKVKDRESDSDELEMAAEGTVQVQQPQMTRDQVEAEQLANAPIIPDTEISPAAYIFQHQEEHEDLNLYEEKSTKIKCPFCDAVSLSIVEYRPSFIGYLLTILAMLIFGILSLVLLPVLVSLTKSAIHRCAKCLNEVKTNSYFGFSSMEDKLVTLQIGKVGVILTRRLLLYTALIVTAMLAIYTFVWIESTQNYEIAPLTDITWEEFRTEVGHTAWMNNPRKTQVLFEQKYLSRGVIWQGSVVRVLLNDEDPMSMAYHAASILIKMDGDDQEGMHGADLGLSISEKTLVMIQNSVDELHRGDIIRFQATIQSLGDSSHLHHFHMWALEKIPGHVNVDAHAHSGGRYKLALGDHSADNQKKDGNAVN